MPALAACLGMLRKKSPKNLALPAPQKQKSATRLPVTGVGGHQRHAPPLS